VTAEGAAATQSEQPRAKMEMRRAIVGRKRGRRIRKRSERTRVEEERTEDSGGVGQRDRMVPERGTRRQAREHARADTRHADPPAGT
jgi:hypothetical protein